MFYFNVKLKANAVIINELEIRNNERISKETISTYGKIILNKDYSQSDLNLIIKNLYDTNFNNISVSVEGKNLF